ncbi:hypothetical protein NEISUBOT_03409 [Neisseria subflava NJ9703]|uniref:Uncharacterized protein n=1 Tax=Neisseria subflava NJ9703 TaxID=546268 RepID=A0A9W5N0K0_NEISU|nr:hypothetical protein NEISUBOT_03409 [Neisseria subflava NJ9703]
MGKQLNALKEDKRPSENIFRRPLLMKQRAGGITAFFQLKP